MSSDRFERNVARLLKKYVSDLRVEAGTNLERGACRIMNRRTNYIAFQITSYYFSDSKQMPEIHLDELAAAKKDLLERFLEQRGPFQPFIEASSEQDNSDNSGSEDGEYAWPNIHQMRHFLVQSTAMERLRESLERFLHPSQGREHSTPFEETEDELSTKQSEPMQNRDRSRASEEDSYRIHNENIYTTCLDTSGLQHSQLGAKAQRITGEIEANSIQPQGRRLLIEEANPINHSPDPVGKGSDILRSALTPAYFSWINRTHTHTFDLHALAFPILQRLYALNERIFRPKLPSGFRRVEWTCDCGQAMYWDIKGISARKAEELASFFDWKNTMAGDSSSNPQQTGSLSRPPQAHINIVSGTAHKQSADAQANKPASNLRSILTSRANPPQPALVPRFLELCVNTGQYSRTVGEANITCIASDGELFSLISDVYYRERAKRGFFQVQTPRIMRGVLGKRRFQWSFLKPTSIIFRKVTNRYHLLLSCTTIHESSILARPGNWD